MRRALAVVLVLTATIVGSGVIVAATRPAGPVLVVAPDVPDDVRVLATATWDRFVEAFPARSGCIPPVALRHAWRLPDRATYDPGARLVVLRVPATAATLRATLIHEFAHHLEFACPQHVSLRRPFLAATGLAPDAGWLAGGSWEDIPSERFAEAVTVHVLGHAPSHLRVPVPAEALGVIERWATGATLT